ncbi:hypothetical protein EYZ11_002136 [Aspergillus tanneri]|uniref:Uncharacterized protein n=1 Tax=Aspergillus tanneri TaxID=1220188 RepID=A0A4S3JRW6_9EURO|nr:hypothetical protein EYZ11_002136 [Aspergillus tanneri]
MSEAANYTKRGNTMNIAAVNAPQDTTMLYDSAAE